MPATNLRIIADAHHAAARRAGPFVFGLAAAIGAAAAWHYAALDLTLSHYDARAHLVVARRVIDNLTPGWRQIGAVWLPLPHLVNLLPVQWDYAYRTGLTAVIASVLSLSIGLAALAGVIARRTGSAAAGVAAALVVLLNPNVLYLQSTPMTEPMLFGLAGLALAATDRWIEQPSPRTRWRAGLLISLLMLTRYEGWAIAGGLVAIAALAHLRRGARFALALVPWVAVTVLAFLAFSKASTDAWFVAGGFFTADNPARHDAAKVYAQIRETTAALGGTALIWAGTIGAGVCLVRALRSAAWLLPWALVLAVALPFVAFYDGHPLRVRYMVPLVFAGGALAGYGVGVLPRRVRAIAAVALVALTSWQRPPFSSDAPMVLEAQWETPFRDARRAVTAALAREWDGTPILASMGSLGHYMQETSSIGLELHDFLHEGSFDLWLASTAMPRRHVRWILIEEHAEGGDVLAARARRDPAFLDGFSRVAEGGGVVLYRRKD